MVLRGAPQSVLGRKEPREPCATRLAQKRGGVLQSPVHRSLMGDDADAAAAHERKTIAEQHVEAVRTDGTVR